MQIAKAFLILCAFAAPALITAQSPQMDVTKTSVTVPALISFGGWLKDTANTPLVGPVAVVFSIYSAEDSRTALWQEQQTVTADALGHYSVQLGAGNEKGFPLAVFTSGNPVWMGARPDVAGVQEQRTLVIAVPFALKAAEADTLAGHPASSYLTRDDLASLPLGTAPVSRGSTGALSAGTSSALTPGMSSTSYPNPLVLGTTVGTVIGGTTNTAILYLQSTSGAGASGSAINFLVGNNGNTSAGSFLNNGNFSLTNGTILNGNPAKNLFVGTGAPAATTAEQNTALGVLALQNLTNGTANTAIGYAAMQQNAAGSKNVAVGVDSLNANTTGSYNTALATDALQGNSTGNHNVAIGAQTMEISSVGNNNTAMGSQAMKNTSGNANTACGISALYANTSGFNNTALGNLAGYTSVGANANVTGDHNTYLGDEAGPGSNTQYSYQTDVGSLATGTCSNCVVLGRPADTTAPQGPVQLASATFASLPASPANGTVVFCADCKDASHGATYGGVAAGGGPGNVVGFENGQWRNH